MTGLDASEVAQLAPDVPRERPPSKLYQGQWAEIEHARQIKEFQTNLDPKTGADPVQAWAGFSRSTWFVYKAKGTIPLDVFARLLARLGLRYALAVKPLRGYLKGAAPSPEAIMRDSDEARQAADIINRYEKDTRKDLLIAVQNKALELAGAPRPQEPAVAIPDNGR